MSRRYLLWLLTGLLLIGLLAGVSGCKEEEETFPREETLKSEGTPPAEAPKAGPETTAATDTVDFEEQEGVPQESPSQLDE